MPSPERGVAAEWVFISYRRADSGGYAQSVYLELKGRYGADRVFFDTEKIDIGADFPLRLKEAVQAARLLIVVIGPDWLKTVNERVARPEIDYVREEIKLALARRQRGEELTILLVLVGGAGAPDAQDLNDALRADLGALATINAHTLRLVPGWVDDLKRLFEKTDPIRAALPDVYAAQHQVEEKLRKEIVAILGRPEMMAIRTAWCADPVHDQRPAKAYALLILLVVFSSPLMLRSRRANARDARDARASSALNSLRR